MTTEIWVSIIAFVCTFLFSVIGYLLTANLKRIEYTMQKLVEVTGNHDSDLKLIKHKLKIPKQ